MRANSTPRNRILFSPGDVVAIDFPGVSGVKRRPAIVVSSPVYHTSRPDLIVCLITSQTVLPGPTDYMLQDWSQAGLRAPSTFRSFFATLPPATHPVLVGHVSERDWQGVCACLKAALAPLSSQQ
ncbi:MAG: type II toxin-antitoxin system PemK/MazF family toxin [Syntrophobacteraceae bacterium]